MRVGHSLGLVVLDVCDIWRDCGAARLVRSRQRGLVRFRQRGLVRSRQRGLRCRADMTCCCTYLERCTRTEGRTSVTLNMKTQPYYPKARTICPPSHSVVLLLAFLNRVIPGVRQKIKSRLSSKSTLFGVISGFSHHVQ